MNIKKLHILTAGLLIIGVSFFLLTGQGSAKDKQSATKNSKQYQPEEVLIKTKQKASLNQIKAELKKQGVITDLGPIENESIKTSSQTKVKSKQNQILKVRVSEDPKKIAHQLEQLAEVEFAEPNYKLQAAASVDDPEYNQQWYLPKAQFDHAWDITHGSSDIKIAVIDTGVDWNHPDLSNDVWENSDEVSDGSDSDSNGYVDDIRGWDFVTQNSCYPGEECDGSEDNDPMDFQGHGTAVSGIASATTNNGTGMAGAGWQTEIMAIRAGYARTGDGKGELLVSDAANAIRYAADNGAQIINLSWGGNYSETIKNAVNYAYSNGAIIVSAAGNEGSNTKYYPAALNNVISVGGTKSDNNRWVSSNYGAWVNISAPAKSIYTTTYNDTYTTASGTSLASPLVAGSIALLKAKQSGLSNQEIVEKLTDLTTSTTSYGITDVLNARNIFRSLKRHPSGSLIREKGTASVYKIVNGKRKGIQSPTFLLNQHRWNDVTDISRSELLSYPRDGYLGFKEGTLVKAKGQGTVYIVEDNKLRAFPSVATFEDFGYRWKNIVEEKSNKIFRAHNTGSNVSSSEVHPDGTLLRAYSGATVYVIKDGKRWPIPSPEIFDSHRLSWSKVIEVSSSYINSIPAKMKLAVRDGTLIRKDGQSSVYYVQNNILRPISKSRFLDLDYKWNRIYDISSTQFSRYKKGLLPNM